MAIKHLPDGEDFGSHPDHFPESFGYSGSVSKSAPAAPATKPPMARRRPLPAPAAAPMSPSGSDEMPMGHAHGGHIEHCAHGGYIVHHPGGMKTHHNADGSMMADHDEAGESAADEVQDKAMMGKAIHQHEAHDHRGEAETDLHLARGGHAHPRLPRNMTPAAGRSHSPIGGGALKPRQMPRSSPASQIEGDKMGYGVNPSDEQPDIGGVPQMSRGGHHRR